MKELKNIFDGLPSELQTKSVLIALITAYYRGADAYRKDVERFSDNVVKDLINTSKLITGEFNDIVNDNFWDLIDTE